MTNFSSATKIEEILKKHPEYYNHMSGLNKL